MLYNILNWVVCIALLAPFALGMIKALTGAF